MISHVKTRGFIRYSHLDQTTDTLYEGWKFADGRTAFAIDCEPVADLPASYVCNRIAELVEHAQVAA